MPVLRSQVVIWEIVHDAVVLGYLLSSRFLCLLLQVSPSTRMEDGGTGITPVVSTGVPNHRPFSSLSPDSDRNKQVVVESEGERFLDS
ncbi:unnamed protein product [Darwinula stevensoni]|uniref:Uncharacterized protein n=1 Tax=Darwinula stevensoni TaxID=69355 RepID=A0A7R9A5S0_9CRUS|nr:unnamed protein product [Darwinula stevensoni]CAG0885849.1 unnamed protein product [Darwinula stevensoni]